jgi:DNA-binding IclR family transcriptional regulator
LEDIVAALSIFGPQRKINTPQEKQYISQGTKAAALISSKLGYMENKIP